ncbi:MAG: N-6 DNA methylase [Patescibacteria group bacterium]|nr:N-6 DNA methylase [Patescibacteria group bacterium]
MLTQETKRKIDSARNILVGKVPDPKAQVEQITTALIYKFMDDMDKEAIELGGKARFFTKGFEKYAWTKLLDQKLGGHERLELYGEAVAKMSQNPHIPQLFRDIFKDAFLPYRSPETLTLFLKEINGFTYDHSEDLGNAFEYLLSILGSQGDAGQFRTPRHIIDFIAEVVDPKKGDTILDPACGTAGFLISAYKHILKQQKDRPLTPDEKKKLMNNLVGYDISPDMVKLSKVNMYLHGFAEPKIFEYDTLSSEEKWDEMYDVIMANPPFMTPKGGITPHQRFSIQSSKAEILFVDYILDHLNLSGRAGVIVPEGIIFDTKAKALRKKLIDNNYLWAVLSLPQGVFNPYTDAKTNILFIDKNIAKKSDEIIFAEVLFDGFDLGLQRNSISKNDLPEIQKILLARTEGKKAGNTQTRLIKKSDIAKNKNYDFFFGRYENSQNTRTHVNSISLRNVLVRNKTQIEIKDSKKYKRVTIKMHGKGICLRDEVLGEKIGTKKQFTVSEGQLLLSKIDARNGAFGIVPEEIEGAIITGNFWAYDIKTDVGLDNNYLNYLLFSDEFKKICTLSSAGVTNRRYLDEKIFLDQKIPLPPIEEQQKIIKEIQEKKKFISEYSQKIETLKTETEGIIGKLWKY